MSQLGVDQLIPFLFYEWMDFYSFFQKSLAHWNNPYALLAGGLSSVLQPVLIDLGVTLPAWAVSVTSGCEDLYLLARAFSWNSRKNNPVLSIPDSSGSHIYSLGAKTSATNSSQLFTLPSHRMAALGNFTSPGAQAQPGSDRVLDLPAIFTSRHFCGRHLRKSEDNLALLGLVTSNQLLPFPGTRSGPGK